MSLINHKLIMKTGTEQNRITGPENVTNENDFISSNNLNIDNSNNQSEDSEQNESPIIEFHNEMIHKGLILILRILQPKGICLTYGPPGITSLNNTAFCDAALDITEPESITEHSSNENIKKITYSWDKSEIIMKLPLNSTTVITESIF